MGDISSERFPTIFQQIVSFQITQFGDFLDDSDTSSMSLVVLTGAAVKRVGPVTTEPGSLPVKVAV